MLPIENQALSMVPEDLDKLEHCFKTILSDRRRIINHHSPIFKLPTETLLEIGKLVLGPCQFRGPNPDDDDFEFSEGKSRFKQVLPLLQTCSQLSSELHLLRHEPHYIEGPVMIYEKLVPAGKFVANVLNPWFEAGMSRAAILLAHASHPSPAYRTALADQYSLRPSAPVGGHPSSSTAAALAGALESLAFGCLRKYPAVFVRIHHGGWDKDPCETESYFVSQERKIVKVPCTGVPEVLGVEESEAIWEFCKDGYDGTEALNLAELVKGN